MLNARVKRFCSCRRLLHFLFATRLVCKGPREGGGGAICCCFRQLLLRCVHTHAHTHTCTRTRINRRPRGSRWHSLMARHGKLRQRTQKVTRRHERLHIHECFIRGELLLLLMAPQITFPQRPVLFALIKCDKRTEVGGR